MLWFHIFLYTLPTKSDEKLPQFGEIWLLACRINVAAPLHALLAGESHLEDLKPFRTWVFRNMMYIYIYVNSSISSHLCMYIYISLSHNLWHMFLLTLTFLTNGTTCVAVEKLHHPMGLNLVHPQDSWVKRTSDVIYIHIDMDIDTDINRWKIPLHPQRLPWVNISFAYIFHDSRNEIGCWVTHPWPNGNNSPCHQR